MINFLKYRWLYFILSSVVIGIGLFSILRWGFVYSIEFVGGTNLSYQADKQIHLESVQRILAREKIETIAVAVKDTNLSLRTKPLDETKEKRLKSSLEEALQIKLALLRSETVGPVIGREMIQKTIIASFIAIIGILIYMSFAFRRFTFAVAAILALLHDFFVVVGSYSLLSHFFGAQLDIMFITALLTTMSFSVHDTIVIFDKIREYFRKGESSDIVLVTNRALTETLVRSFNNSMTIIFMLLALILLGGSTMRFFIATLLIGTITGTYSSPFVAAPLLAWFEKIKRKE